MRNWCRFVALGDSIVSDDYPGPGLGAVSLLHRNEDGRFPDFKGRDLVTLVPRLEFHNHTRTGWMLPDLKSEVGHLSPSDGATLVVVCIGGNDLLHAFADGVPAGQALAQIRSGYQDLLEQLKGRYSDLTLRLVNAYDPTDGTGKFQSGRHMPEAPAAVAALNELIAQLAGPNLVDIHSHCLGHGMRHKDPDYQHFDPQDPSGWFKMDIEPNNTGAHQIRAKIWESL